MTDKINLTYGQAEMLLGNEQFKELAAKPFPIRISFRLARVLKKIDSELEFYLQKKQELIQKYAMRREDGKLTDENGMVKFETDEGPIQITELASEKLVLNETKIPLSLDKCPDLSMQETMMLLEFVEEIEDNPEEGVIGEE